MTNFHPPKCDRLGINQPTDSSIYLDDSLGPPYPIAVSSPLFFLYSSNEFERTIVGSCRSSNSSSGTSKQQQRDTSTGRPTAATTPVDCSSNAIRTTTNDRFSVAFVNRTIFDLIYWLSRTNEKGRSDTRRVYTTFYLPFLIVVVLSHWRVLWVIFLTLNIRTRKNVPTRRNCCRRCVNVYF